MQWFLSEATGSHSGWRTSRLIAVFPHCLKTRHDVFLPHRLRIIHNNLTILGYMTYIADKVSLNRSKTFTSGTRKTEAWESN